VITPLRTRLRTLLAYVVLACACGTSGAQTVRPAVTTYGERNAAAPKELEVFAFLIGKWEGNASVKLPDGTTAEVPFTWIGRYVLDGMAIADEVHSTGPGGAPVFGITLRQYDVSKSTWIVEFLNVSNSFLRRQVNAEAGSVGIEGNAVVVVSEAPDTWSREKYRVDSRDSFTYSLELSNDGGRSWNSVFEVQLARTE
jgi:hypothetical protein